MLRAKRRFVFQKKLVKATIPAGRLAVRQPMVQIKLEPSDFQNVTILKPADPLRQIVPKLKAANKSTAILTEECQENVTILKPADPLGQIVPKLKVANKSMVVYMCKQCDIYFPIRRMLELHDKSTHQKKSPKDKVCRGYYKDSKGVYNCQFCSFASTIRSSVASHAARRHNSLIKAQNMEETPQPIQSVKVEKVDAIEEEKEDHEDDENNWEVETLDENLPVLAKIKEKKDKDPSKTAVVRKCPFCPFMSDNSSTYRSHVKRKHYHDWMKLQGKEVAEGERYQEKRKPKPLKEKPPQDPIKKIGNLRSCPQCPFETYSKSTLYSHVNRSHRGKRPGKRRLKAIGVTTGKRCYNAFAFTGYACSYCTFAAATMSSLRYHTAREHGDKKQPIIEFPVDEFDCEQCDYKTKSRKSMQAHVKTVHLVMANEEGMFTCHLCSYESLSRMGVQRHISVKHDKLRREAKKEAGTEPEIFTCEHCEYRTYNAKVLNWHKKQHNANVNSEDDGNIYFCNDCEFTTWTKGQIYTHIKRSHKEEEYGTGQEKRSDEVGDGSEPVFESHFVCDLCDYTSKNKHVMKVHVIRKHTDGFNHSCELCGKQYKVKADLTNHMRFQHREQPVVCDVCGKSCRNSNLLYLHQKFAHYKPEFECHICHRRMVSQANLDEHILKQHEQRQNAMCEECGKIFTRQSRLKIHMRTHLGLRPYNCHICGKTFARKNGLRQHLLIHTGQRPYICDICGKDFVQKTGLISHRKSHPGSHPPLPRVYIDHVLSSLTNEEKTSSRSSSPQKRCVIDESGNECVEEVEESQIMPKFEDEDEDDDGDEDFRLEDYEDEIDEDDDEIKDEEIDEDDVEMKDEEIDEDEDEIKDVEKLETENENEFEDFEDFEEVSIDGSCSTAKPLPSIAIKTEDGTASPPSLPKFDLSNAEKGSKIKYEVPTPEVIYMCKTCKIYFPKRSMLDTHMSTVHDETTKTTPDKFAERHARAGYMRLDDGTYRCRFCDYSAPGRTTVSTHVGRKHGRRRPLTPGWKPKKIVADKPVNRKRKRKPKPPPEPTDGKMVYITKVVMTVDNLKSQPEPDEILEAVNSILDDQVPEVLNEEEVVDGDVSHVQRICEYSCPYCRFETRRRAEMHTHITEEHNEAWYESVAQQEAEREILKQKESFNPTDGRHYCHYCPFSATSRATLNAHTRRKHKGFVQPYRSRKLAPVEFHCDQCDFKTMYRHKIQSHIERKHVAEPRYTCEYCGRKYKTKSDMTSHMRFQHFHQPLVCEVCGKVCSNSNALHIHKKREHFKPDFECQTCHRRMVSQANLDEHIQRQHTEKQHYMCETCGKVFDQPCKLKQHTMTHTGEKPNICHICGKAFARRAVFRQHLLIHSGERPYVCDICGKSFTQKPGLICHRKSHPGDKPPLPVVYIDSILDKFLSKS